MELLQSRSLISINGEDKVNFLQNILSNDINKLKSEKIIYTLLLSSNGRFLHDIFIFQDDNNLYLDILAERKEDFIKRLSIYKLRSNVTIQNLDNIQVYFSETFHTEKFCFPDPRLKNFGYRLYGKFDNDSNNYNQLRIINLIPEAETELKYDKSFPLEFGMDYLNAIDFEKGCYIGQELTTRTKRRGVIRKAIYLAEADQELNTGDVILDYMENPIGNIMSTYNNIGISQVRIEELEKSEYKAYVNGKKINLTKAKWYE